MSGPDNSAAKEANAAEKRRTAGIANTQKRINQTFDSPGRAADIADVVDAVRQYHTQDLDKQKVDGDRELKFALARSGQLGSSTQVDQSAILGDEYQRGVLDVQRKALGAGSELETADQEARARLISLATSGLDATTGASQAAAAMRTSLEAGKNTAMAQGLGDVFGKTKGFADKSRDAAERRRANQDAGWNMYAPMGYGGGS